MITPDDKDWTWVVQRRCPECGFDASAITGLEVADVVRENAGDWQRLLDAGQIRAGRPSPDTWSSLEYACHVRDVYLRYDARFELMLTADDPLFPNWDQDVTAVDDRYEEQDPATVVVDLVVAAGLLADRLDRLTEPEWTRTGTRGDGAAFTLDTISRYLAHDPVHHIWDVAGEPTA